MPRAQADPSPSTNGALSGINLFGELDQPVDPAGLEAGERFAVLDVVEDFGFQQTNAIEGLGSLFFPAAHILQIASLAFQHALGCAEQGGVLLRLLDHGIAFFGQGIAFELEPAGFRERLIAFRLGLLAGLLGGVRLLA